MAYIGNSPATIQQARTAEYEFTATAGQTVFTGVDNNGLTLDLLNANQNEVFFNGSRLVSDDDFTVSGDTLTLTSGAASGDILVIKTQSEVLNAGSYTKAESDSRYVNYSGDIINGNLQVVGTVTSTDLQIDSGTANGVTYLNGSKALTSGSALTFDGSTFAVNSAASIGSDTAKTKFYSDSTYNGIFNGASLGSNESIYMGGGAQFFFAGGSERMRIASNGDISFYEDTGTTADFFWDASAERLQIGGNAQAGGRLYLESGTATSFIRMHCTTGTGGVHTIQASGTNGLLLDINADQTLALNTNGSERFRITNAGNVGIGTTLPTGKFEVNGGRSWFTGNNDLYSLAVRYGAGTGTMYIGATNSANPSMQFSNGGGGALVNIDWNGNVGIGTTNPSTALHVQKSVSGDFISTFQNTNSSTPYGVWVKDAATPANGYPLLQVTNSAGTGTYFRVDSGTGYVTLPYQPSFFAYHNGGDIYYTPGQILPYQNTRHNVGNHYNTSTSTFTAPIAGTYMFSATVNAAHSSSYSDVPRAYWQVNGSNIGNNVHFRGNDLQGGSSSGLTQRSATIILQLSANDTVRIQVQINRFDLFGANHFCGHLIG